MITTSTYHDHEQIVWTVVDAISEHYNGHVCVAGSYAMVKAINYMDRILHSDPEQRPAGFYPNRKKYK